MTICELFIFNKKTMKISFIENIPENYDELPVLISGDSSKDWNGRQYLALSTENEIIKIFEIRFEYNCSPFKQADILNNVIGIGLEEHYYLYNIVQNENLAIVKLSGYFGHTYQDDDLIYVADANGLHCFDQNGTKIWDNSELGIDGVIIHEFTQSEIYGSGECDPPGGWEDFILDKRSGKRKNEFK